MQEKETEKNGQQSDDGIVVDSFGSDKIRTVILSVFVIMLLIPIIAVVIMSDTDKDEKMPISSYEIFPDTEEKEYTHSLKVYFLSDELGRAFVAEPEILDNELIAKMVETYLFAGNFDKGYYVFGNIRKEKELNKIYFDDPVGGKIGLMKDGWNVTFNYKLLEFLCDGVSLNEYLSNSYENGKSESIDRITDMFIVCIPGYPAFVHFKTKEQIYFMTLEYNGYIASKDYRIYTRQDFSESIALQNVDVVINESEENIISGIASVNAAGGYEIDIVALLDVVFDEEHIYHNIGKTSVYVTDKETGKKHLYVFINTQRLFFNVKEKYTDKGLPSDNWKPENEKAYYDFRQGKLYLNEAAAKEFLSLFEIRMDITDTINISFDEEENRFICDK